MTAFIAFAALLAAATIALVAGSLARRPRGARSSADDVNAAVYRDQLAELDAQLAQGALDAEHHAAAREAVRLRLAGDLRASSGSLAAGGSRAGAIAAGLAIAVGAGALYALLGTPAALSPQAAAARQDPAHGLQGEQILGMIERLAGRLRDNPEDLNGWVMLARSFSALGRFDDASRAYAEAVKRADKDAVLLADYADVLAMAQGRSFRGEPDRLIARALEADPRHVKSLALAGSSAFARQDYQRAVEYWTRIDVPPDSPMGRSIEGSIAQARQLAAEKPGAAAAAARVDRSVPATGEAGRIRGRVTLAPALAARVEPGDTLFVFAVPADGSRMPIAIVRQPVGAWPASFTLDDSSAMSGASRLSAQQKVVIEARISKSGNAVAAAGDLRGGLTQIKVGAAGVVVNIDSIIE